MVLRSSANFATFHSTIKTTKPTHKRTEKNDE